jgi:glycogen operon protein
MLLAGDEFRRTQRGNNNAYCQDNEISWIDWSLAEQHPDLVAFTRWALAFRRAHPVLRQEAFYMDRDLHWFDPAGCSPDWDDPGQRALACQIHGVNGPDLYLMFNAGSAPAGFLLPEAPDGREWQLAVDTARETPDRGAGTEQALMLDRPFYSLASRSSAILVAAAAR